MKDYPGRAAGFLIILTGFACAAAFLLVQYSNETSLELLPLFIWAAIGIWSESNSVFIDEGNIHLSPVDAVFFAAYLTSGAASALIVILATELLRFRRSGLRGNLFNTPFRLTLFNVCHYILILGIIHLCYTILENTTGLNLFPALFTAPMFFLFSCILNALFYKLEEGRSFFHYLKQIFMPHFMNGLAASFAAVIIALTYPRFGFISLFFFFIPILVTRLLYIERKEG